jgi:hypothetical protein
MKTNKIYVVYPVRFQREFFERVLATAKREDMNAAQFIRRAAQRELEARESVFEKSLRRMSAGK